MAGYKQGVVSVGTSPTVIATIGAAPETGGIVVQNNGSAAVFLGGSNVTSSGATAGVQLATGATLTIPTTGAEPLTLYGVVATATQNVSYIFPG